MRNSCSVNSLFFPVRFHSGFVLSNQLGFLDSLCFFCLLCFLNWLMPLINFRAPTHNCKPIQTNYCFPEWHKETCRVCHPDNNAIALLQYNTIQYNMPSCTLILSCLHRLLFCCSILPGWTLLESLMGDRRRRCPWFHPHPDTASLCIYRHWAVYAKPHIFIKLFLRSNLTFFSVVCDGTGKETEKL